VQVCSFTLFGLGRRAMSEQLKKLMVESYEQGAKDVLASVKDGVEELEATGVMQINTADLKELLKEFEKNVTGL
jgi:hypothetical protein